MTADKLPYQLGGITSEIILMVIVFQLVHWTVRKIRRRPKMPFRASPPRWR